MGAVLLWERAEYSTVGRSPPEVVIHNLMDMKLCPYLKGLGHARSKQADFRAEGHATGCSAAIMPAILRLANSSNANAPRGGAAQHNVLSGSATGRSLCLSF